MITPEPAPGLYCELYWGAGLSEAWSFGPDVERVLAAPDEGAPLPLYGFTFPEEPFLLAERAGTHLRIFVPPASRAERRRGKQGPWEPVEPALDGQGRRVLELEGEMTLRLIQGELALWLQPSLRRVRVAKQGVREFFWIAAIAGLFISAPLGFFAMWPDPARQAEANARAIANARAKAEAERRALGVDGPLKPLEQAGGPDGGAIPLPLIVR